MTVTNLTPPTITGSTVRGSTLTAHDGTWSTDQPDTDLEFSYQWERDDADIAAATNSTYLLQNADVGSFIKVRVTAHEVAAPLGPPPTAGTALTTFADFQNNRFGAGDTILINRSENPVGYQAVSDPTDPWPAPVSGLAITEVSTVDGDGFFFKSDAQMDVPSGGKKSEIGDLDHLIQVGTYQVWRGKIKFPNTQTGYAANNSWNLLFEYHDTGNVLQFGVNGDPGFGVVPGFYFRSAGSSWNYHVYCEPIVINQVYEFELHIKLSTGSDGYIKFMLDGVTKAERTGQNMHAGQQPYLQFGYYGAAQYYNEVYFLDMSLENV